MKLVYWVALCHTKDCKTLHPAKLLGEFNEEAHYTIPDHAPKFFAYDCPSCRKRHTYPQTELYVTELEGPPSLIWQEWW